jgi:pimeloyl-ACP methyl ester carboxylesterase
VERLGFLPVAGEKIFTLYHEPARTLAGAAGVLMVHAFAEEKLWTGRASTRLARRLADAGLPVLRFDLRGHGDSDREHHELDMASVRADLAAAAARLRELSGEAAIQLFGFRLGGSLALRFAAELAASAVALVNPLASGSAYLLRILRSNLTTQMGIYGEVRQDREALLAAMRETGLLNIDGYHVGAGFHDELAALDLKGAPAAFAGPGLVLSLGRREDAPADADAKAVFEAVLAGHPSSRLETLCHAPLWAEQKRFAIGDEALFAPLVDWCAGGWRGGAA